MNEEDPARRLGREGEELAAQALRKRGLQIVARNVRLPSTELDLVARDRDGWVFVEVKTRTSARFGAPYEAVDAAKRQRLERGAREFLATLPRREAERNYRFGVVSIVILDRRVALEWIDEG